MSTSNSGIADYFRPQDYEQTQGMLTSSGPKATPTSIQERMIDQLTSYNESNERHVAKLRADSMSAH
ncbi:hypothetical protein PVK06_016965 [Gossypium arboreum]|uniref:Uncharacterized protein n=1 Tax=Gossypium arboreum TaxID=29729 RepID=A0ABR0Q287_GOSAR|nr:hypothetical protein PVK06_016965 [Gossypium arboreum]